MFRLSSAQMGKIHEYQAAEIDRLATDRDFAISASKREHYSKVGEWILPERPGRALELGCGPGRYAAMLASSGHEVVAVDPYSYDTWELILRHRKVDFVSGVFAEELPYPDDSFDYVACMGALLYFKDASKALSEVRRVLRPGGRIVVRNINRRNMYRLVRGRHIDPATNNAYTAQELAAFLGENDFLVRHHFAHGFYSPFFSQQYWYLLNGPLSDEAQQRISNMVPAAFRTTVTAFAEL